jgi:hypothetical protein
MEDAVETDGWEWEWVRMKEGPYIPFIKYGNT